MFACRPFFRWGWPGEESELTLALPQRPWRYIEGGVGGHIVAASGIPEDYAIREDDVLLLDLRVKESELPAFRQFMRWARSSGEAFTLMLDALLEDTEFRVYLDEPATWNATARFEYTRDASFPGVFLVTIGVRPELGGTFDVSWFGTAVDPDF